MRPKLDLKMQEKISVLVIDDSPIFQRLLCELLERQTGVCVVGTAGNGEKGFASARQLKPWVIVVDLDMQLFTNPYAIAHLRAKSPGSVIIGMTLLDHLILPQAQQKFGVDAILTKENIHIDLLPTIQKLCTFCGQSQIYLDNRISVS